MTNWKRIAAGYYEAEREGAIVARVKRIKNTGEPVWQLTVLDDTPYSETASGRVIDEYYSLAGAKFAYAHNRHRMNPNWWKK